MGKDVVKVCMKDEWSEEETVEIWNAEKQSYMMDGMESEYRENVATCIIVLHRETIHSWMLVGCIYK